MLSNGSNSVLRVDEDKNIVIPEFAVAETLGGQCSLHEYIKKGVEYLDSFKTDRIKRLLSRKKINLDLFEECYQREKDLFFEGRLNLS